MKLVEFQWSMKDDCSGKERSACAQKHELENEEDDESLAHCGKLAQMTDSLCRTRNSLSCARQYELAPLNVTCTGRKDAIMIGRLHMKP